MLDTQLYDVILWEDVLIACGLAEDKHADLYTQTTTAGSTAPSEPQKSVQASITMNGFTPPLHNQPTEETGNSSTVSTHSYYDYYLYKYIRKGHL